MTFDFRTLNESYPVLLKCIETSDETSAKQLGDILRVLQVFQANTEELLEFLANNEIDQSQDVVALDERIVSRSDLILDGLILHALLSHAFRFARGDQSILTRPSISGKSLKNTLTFLDYGESFLSHKDNHEWFDLQLKTFSDSDGNLVYDSFDR